MKKKNKIRTKGIDGHIPCKYRRRETRYGVTMDRCYAIGCCELGDMPCEYCNERDWGNNGEDMSGYQRAKCCKCGRVVSAPDVKSFRDKSRGWRYAPGVMEWFCPKCNAGMPLKGPGSRPGRRA